MTLISLFKQELVDSISIKQNFNLIRKHDKNLDNGGDFSFPSLENNRVWSSSCDASEVVNKSKTFSSMKIDKIVKDGKCCQVFVDRNLALKSFFNGKCRRKHSGTFEVQNLEDPLKSDLTSERVKLLAQILENCLILVGVPLSTHFTLGASKRKDSLEKHDVTKHLQVGPVLGPNGKKFVGSVQEYKSQVLSHIETLDQERNDPQESEEVRLARLDTLVSAQVLFDLVSTSPASATTISSTTGSSCATFVLYNSARISQIIYSFHASVDQGIYPDLPPYPDWSLLDQSEEWEIFFVYILPYPDILEDAVNNLKLHRITIHLIGLSNCLSRYYSRVKILRDPLPKLIPVMHTRIGFLKEVQKIIRSSLDILGLQDLNKM